MHTTTYPNPEGRDINMHHNGDYSGHVTVMLPRARVHDVDGTDGNIVAAEIPFGAFLYLVAGMVRSELMGKLEEADDLDLVTDAWRGLA